MLDLLVPRQLSMFLVRVRAVAHRSNDDQSVAAAYPPASTAAKLTTSEAAHTIAVRMLEERGYSADLVGVARFDATLERLLIAALPLRAPGLPAHSFSPAG